MCVCKSIIAFLFIVNIVYVDNKEDAYAKIIIRIF